LNAPVPRLVYGPDRKLRDGERVLSDFREEGPYGCIVVDGAEYEVAHPGRSGWRFRLVDARARRERLRVRPVPGRAGRAAARTLGSGEQELLVPAAGGGGG
jgi:hypothetical protein